MAHRSLFLFCLSLVGLKVDAQCTSSGLAGFTCQHTVNSDVVIHYALASDKQTVKLAIEANTEGYAAVGVGTGMVGAHVVLGYVSNGAATVETLVPAQKSVSGVTGGILDKAAATWASDYTVSEANGKTTTSFTYNIAAGGKFTDTTAAPLVWSLRNTDEILKHTSRGTLTLNLDQSLPVAVTPVPTAATPAPIGTPSATPAPVPVVTNAPTPPITPTPATPQPTTVTTASCVASSDPAFTCQQNIGPMVLRWRLSSGTTVVTFSVTSPGLGYVGLGFGTQMVGSTAVIGYMSGTATVGTYLLNGKNGPQNIVATTTSWLLAGSDSVSQNAGTTTLQFSRTTAQLNLASVAMVAAYHATDNISHHTGRAPFTVALDAVPSSQVTSQPATTTTPVGPVPVPRGGSACTASPLARQGATGTYDCMSQLDGSVSLHWTLQTGRRLFALQSSAQGYIAIGFPETPGKMGPAEALIATADGAQKYQIGSAKSASALQVSNSVLQNVEGLGMNTVGGATVLFWEEVTATQGRDAAAQQSSQLLNFNIAYHDSSRGITQHSVRRSVEIDLESATLADTTSSKKDKVKTHAGFQVFVWAYLVPIAILAKAGGPMVTSAKVATFPVPFVVHAVLMFIGIILNIAMVGLALDQFSSGTESSHKEIGIAVMCGSIFQLVMQVAKPDMSNPLRPIFRLVHAGLGILTLSLAYIQLFTGADNYERLYPEDKDFARGTRVATIVGIVVFCVAYIIVNVLRHVVARHEVNSKAAAEDTAPNTA